MTSSPQATQQMPAPTQTFTQGTSPVPVAAPSPSQPSSQVPLTGSSSSSVMSGWLADHFSTNVVSIHLDPGCSKVIREHVAYLDSPDPNPELFVFRCDSFLSDDLQQEWHNLPWGDRNTRLLEHEQSLDQHHDSPPPCGFG